MPVREMELVFPLKGVNDAWAFSRQPDGTCPDALNVVPFDPLDSRARGGQRWGLSKYYSALHNGATAIQRLTSITDLILAGITTADAFTQANGVLDNTNWYPATYDPAYPTIDTSASYPHIESNKIDHNNTTTPGRTTGFAFHKTAIEVSGTILELSYDVSFVITDDLTWRSLDFGFIFRAPSGSTLPFSVATVNRAFFKWSNFADQTEDLGIWFNGHGFETYEATSSTNDYTDPTWWATAREIKITLIGNTYKFYIAGELVGTYTSTTNAGQTVVGIYFNKGLGTDDVITIDNFSAQVIDPSSGRTHKLVSVSGGDVFYGIIPNALSAATNGTNALATSGRVDMQTAFDKLYFADGDPAHYKYFDNSNNTVSTWTPTGGTLPMGSDQTAVNITGADTGNKTITVAEDWSSRVAGDYLLVAGSDDNNGYYTIASLSGSGPTVITMNEAVPADSGASGTIQYQDRACTIIKLYRGRIVMSGLKTDRHNWFMTAAGNPLDIDYGATVSATMAVAGNNTDAGYCPDIITCLAPYSDDMMFIGGDHTLWLMRGDPADRGRIDNISYQTGISGPDAYTFDPNGIFYFFGSGTIWRMAAGGVPEPLSRNRMDQVLNAIDLTTNTVHLAWDNIRHGLYIFVVPNASGSTTHYYWDERTDGFWPISFPNAQGPTTVYAFDGDNPGDNALLLGGWDGYIRQVDSLVTDDDGTAISSYVLYPPIAVGGPSRNIRVNGITAVLDTNSDDAILTAYAEDTVQKTVESTTIRFARTLSAGRTKILNRVAGNAVMLKLSNSVDETTWAIESMIANVEVIGHTRKNQL